MVLVRARHEDCLGGTVQHLLRVKIIVFVVVAGVEASPEALPVSHAFHVPRLGAQSVSPLLAHQQKVSVALGAVAYSWQRK